MDCAIAPTAGTGAPRVRPSRWRPRALLCACAVLLGLPLASPRAAAAALTLKAGSWTIWQDTLEIADEVVVEVGATLLVQPGTTVRFAAGTLEDGRPRTRLTVHGALVAQGTAEEPITFTSAAAEPRPGDWGGIVLEKSAEHQNRLAHARIEYASPGVTGMGTQLVAEDVVIRRCITGIYARQNLTGWVFRGSIVENRVGVVYEQCSSFHVEDSEVARNEAGGVACLQGSSPNIRFTTIVDNGPRGIVCQQGSSPLIQGNTIRGHERGIFLELQSRPRINRNLIAGNGTGIWGEKLVFPTVEANEITANGTGIYCNYSAYMVINGNNIRDNRGLALVLGDNMSVLMERQIPFRHLGRFYFGQPPPEVTAEPLPAQSQKFKPLPEETGVVDARGNWWGEGPTEEMARLGEDGNAAAIEDFHDKPDTFYEGQAYRRDRVAFAPTASGPVDAGPPAKRNSGVTGKVVLGGAPLPGVRVHAYPDASGALKGAGQVYSGPTQRDGGFTLHLPAGTYYLVAKGPVPPIPWEDPQADGLFGYYGGNPVTVSPGAYAGANIQAVRRRPVLVVPEKGDAARLEGIVLGPDGPVEGASVHLYTDESRQFRGPDLFGPQGAVPGGTDGKGAFAFEVPPGRYFLVASKRQAGGVLGPLHPGDLHGWFDGNPLAPASGTKATIVIQAVEKLRESAATTAPPAAATAIRGRILDPAGQVPAGVYAFATTDPSFMIGAMPPHRSQPLGPDGSYVIQLPQGGTYYVSARSGYGGPPLPGEWHGFHGEKTPRAVSVETGSVTGGIDFVVKRME